MLAKMVAIVDVLSCMRPVDSLVKAKVHSIPFTIYSTKPLSIIKI